MYKMDFLSIFNYKIFLHLILKFIILPLKKFDIFFNAHYTILNIRGYGSAGRATRSQRVGQGFESPYLHQIRKSNILIHLLYLLHEKGADMVRKDEGFYLIKRNIKDNFPKENRNSNKV